MLQNDSSMVNLVDDHAAENLAAQEAAMQQVGQVGVENSDHAMEIGTRPQTSDVKPTEIPTVTLATAAQPQQLVVTKPATTPPAAQMGCPPLAAAGSIHAAVASQQADAHMRAGAALLLEAALTSSHDSAGTGLLHSSTQQSKHSTKQPYGQQTFVPRKDANDNIPCFVQTSALFTNMCGYCGTRSTSGCWRRGWEIAPNKFINLCNKCGLRHKAGKLPSVPEPPPPQLRGRAAAAAAAAAAGTSFTTASGAHSYETSGHLHHSTSAAELMHLATGQASPNLSTGLHEAAASDPTAGAVQGVAAAGNGRRRRTQKPLTPKWSRVGPPATDFSHDQHMFAQLLAAGALSSSGGSMDMYAGMPGGLGTDHQQQQQRELAALLQSLVEGGAAQAQAGYATPADLHNHHHPASHSNITGNHNDSTLSLAHYAAAAQTAPMPSSSAAPPHTTAAAGAMPMDSAQAVAAVLAAAAAAASSDSKAAPVQGHPALKLSKLSVGSGGSGAFDTSQMSSPAAKKRRTKKEAAEEDGLPGSSGVGPSGGGRGGEAGKAAQRAEDAAAAGDAADALLALRSSAKPESPSWARLQQATPNTLAPRANPVTTSGMEGMNMMGMNMSRQVTSPSVDTTGGGVSRANGLAQYLQPLQPQHTSSTHLQMPPPQPPPHTHHHPGSHLEPLTQAAPSFHNFTWSPEQLEARLQAWGCGEAAAAFRAHGIEGHALSGLMRVAVDAGAARLDERLRTDLGVEAVGLRLQLVDRMMAEVAAAHRGQGFH